MRNRRKYGGFGGQLNNGRRSPFLSDLPSSSDVEQIRSSINDDSSSTMSLVQFQEETTKIFVQDADDANVTFSGALTTERNLDLIKRKMMLMQIGMKRRYGRGRMSQDAFGVSGILPPMPGKSQRPNVFETREERRRRLLDEER